MRYTVEELFGNASSVAENRDGSVSLAPSASPSAPRLKVNLPGLKKRLAKLSDPKIQKVLAGESFAERGGRDAAMQSVCSTIVWAAHGHGEPEELAKILKKSLKVWAEEPGAKLTLDDELAKAEEKFERALCDFDAKEGAATAERDDYIKMLGRRLIGENFGADGVAPERCLIIQHKRSYYVYDTESDQYYGSFIKDELLTIARDYFRTGKVPTTYVNADGIEKPMTLPMVLDKYCTVVRNLEGSLSLRKGQLDAAQSLFVHAVAPIRKLAPRFDPQIDEWLRSFSRDPRLVEGVLDWVAGVSQLNAQCSALVLIGPPDTGKTTLAHGLSRLWHVNGPTEWSNAVGANFNESIVHCPLIELSEGFGSNQRWNTGQSNEFRKVVGSQSVQINPKGLTPYWIKGTVRIIIGSNDDTVLTDLVGGREVSADSIEAIAKRLFVVDVSKRPKLLIDGWKEKDPHTVDRWIENDYLARHSLWLAEDRVRLKSLRFLVEGDVASVHHRLTARRSDSESLLEWITGYMMSPGKFETAMKQAKREPMSSCGNGVLLLHGEEVNTTWKLYVNTDTGPLLGAPKVSRLLGNLRTSKRKLNRNGCRINVHQINPAVVFEFAKASMLGDRDVMTTTLNRKLNGVVFEELPDED